MTVDRPFKSGSGVASDGGGSGSGSGGDSVLLSKHSSRAPKFTSPRYPSPRSSSSPIPAVSTSQESARFPELEPEQDDILPEEHDGLSSSAPGRAKLSKPEFSAGSRSHNSSTAVPPGRRSLDYIQSRRPTMSPGPEKRNKSKNKVHILPHRRKTSQTGSTSLDLSLSTVENEGLGIYTNLDRNRRYHDSYINSGRVSVAAGHRRSVSGNSQISVPTMPTVNKPGTQYVHPMRQTPRPYTPPLSRSHQNSVTGSLPSDAHQASDLDEQPQTNQRDTFRPHHTVVSDMEPRRSFNLQRKSLTYLQTSSQTNIPSRTSSSFSRPYENGSVRETISPVSRKSLEYAFRSRSRASTSDPIARAAAVQAARQAFEDREAEKMRKHEDKELRKLERQENHNNHHQNSTKKPHLANLSLRNHRLSSEKSSNSVPRRSSATNHQSGTDYDYEGEKRNGVKLRSPKSAWILFLTWLRTRIFKMGKKMKKRG